MAQGAMLMLPLAIAIRWEGTDGIKWNGCRMSLNCATARFVLNLKRNVSCSMLQSVVLKLERGFLPSTVYYDPFGVLSMKDDSLSHGTLQWKRISRHMLQSITLFCSMPLFTWNTIGGSPACHTQTLMV
jgi:hypothetical protein